MSRFKSFLNPASALRAALVRFRTDQRGNIAVIFAVSILPILGLVGAAVDYTRANNARTALQSALDTTSLMISKDAAGMTASQIQARAQQYFNALYTNTEAPVQNFTATYTANSGTGSTVSVTANSTIQTDFIKVLGSNYNQLGLNGASTTKWGSTKLRVALALDNTGSMADNGKIAALRTAATNLVTQLSGSATNTGDVMISLIPFAKDVNVGTSNVNASWINWSGESDTWEENNGTCSKSGYSSKSSCQGQNVCSISGKNSQSSCTSAGVCSNTSYTSQNNCTSAGTCSRSQYTSSSSCTSHSGTWTANTWTTGVWAAAVWTPSNHSNWTGCVTDRDQDYDTMSTAPSSSDPTTLFPADEYYENNEYYCKPGNNPPLQQVTALSYDWSTLKSNIAAMQPTGGTNQAIGLAWGWLSLQQTAPLNAPAEDSNYQWSHVIILLSDGLNTEDRWPAYGNGVTQYSCPGNVMCIDARQKKLCDNIKAATDSKGNPLYTIYTIQVNTGSDPTSSVLQYCASDSSKFFMLTTANQIISTFDSIGTQLAKLRISQ
jgi:Flp pilus assembly protein TadG